MKNEKRSLTDEKEISDIMYSSRIEFDARGASIREESCDEEGRAPVRLAEMPHSLRSVRELPWRELAEDDV